MINNDQSTIIEAPDKSIPTHSPLQNQRHNVPETKMSALTPLMDMLWSIIPNLQEIISDLLD